MRPAGIKAEVLRATDGALGGVYTPRPDAYQYRTLDHWRGVAALGAMAFHGFGGMRMGQVPPHASVAWLKMLSDVGWFGVHLFFVISGYCIAASIYNLSQKGVGPLAFLSDRLLRIYPAYWAACLVSIAVNAVTAPFNHISLNATLPIEWNAAVANFLLIEPYVGLDGTFLLVGWSLVYEVGFYALVAVGFGLYSCGVNVWILGSAAALLTIGGLLGGHSAWLYVLLYWPDFLFGVIVFTVLWARQRSNRGAWLLLLVPSLLVLQLLGGQDMDRLKQVLGTGCFALLLIWLHRWDAILAGWRGMRWLAWVGTMSYSLYLVHVPLGSRVINLAGRWIRPDSVWVLPLELVYWMVCLFAAYAFFQLCEKPLNGLRHRIKQHALNVAVGVAK